MKKITLGEKKTHEYIYTMYLYLLVNIIKTSKFLEQLEILPKCEKKASHQAFIQTSGAEEEAVEEDFTIIDDYDDLAYVQEMLAHQR